MGTEGIEPPAAGLEPAILPLNHAPNQLHQIKKKYVLKSFVGIILPIKDF